MAEQPMQRAVVIGDGGWGTTLSMLLVRNGVHTTLWSASPEHAAELRQRRENLRYLPGVPIPEGIEITADPFAAASEVDFAVGAVPTQYLRGVALRFEDALPGAVPVATATKGIEIETFKTPSEILAEVLGRRPIVVLTGPSHAEEVARGLPASIVAASADTTLARGFQAVLSSDTFRVY